MSGVLLPLLGRFKFQKYRQVIRSQCLSVDHLTKKFKPPTRPGNPGTSHAHFFRQFLKGKIRKIVILSLKESLQDFKSALLKYKR